MNQVQVFSNNQFGEIRTLEENGKVLFCGSDVAKALGYSKPLNALNTHCNGTLKRGIIDSMGREQQANFIPEGDVYRLITHSKLPEAQKFESWVFDEVLPSVRSHGAYMTPDTIEKVLMNPDTIIELATRLKAEQAKVAALAPKGEYYDTVTGSEGSMSIRDTAKVLGVREKEFTAFLEEKKLCFRNRNGRGRLEPYAEYLHEKHWFEMTEFSVTKNGNTKSGFQTKITPKGRQKIHELMEKGGTT